MLSNAVLLATMLAVGGEEILARVDGAAINRTTFTLRYETLRTQGRKIQPADLLDGLVSEALLAAEARRLGLARDPQVASRLEAERRRVAASLLVEKEIAANVSPPESALREMFHATGDFVRFQLLSYETREAAQAALERVGKGSTFSTEAKSALTARVYARPADAPLTMRAEVEPAIASAVFAAAQGAVVGPLQLSPGWAVAQVLEKQIGDEPTFAARRGAILQHARKKYTAQARQHLATQLRSKAGIALDEAFLRGLQGTAASPSDLAHVLATINGRPLLYSDIYPGVRSLAGNASTGHLTSPSLKIQLAWQEIDARLLQEAALARGYDKVPDAAAPNAAVERSVLAAALAARIERQAPAPSEAEIEAFYKQYASAYGRPFEQVLPDVAARAAAQKRGAAVEARAQELRKTASVAIDQAALKRAASPEI
jgi:hypothetical protein